MKDRGSELDSQYFADGQPPLLNHKAAYDVETIAHALTNIYRRNVDVDHDIEPYLYEETQRIMDEAIAEGYANAAENNIPTPDEAFRNAFSHSADVFSAFRVHKMQTDIAAQMLDSDGHLKPFSKFVKDVSPYIEHRNRAWLQTEYDTAIIRAQNAAEWQQFQAEKDVFPNLEWIPSTSPNPGADHQVFWGTVLPVDHPFWNEHKPGDRWNCKCELRQTDRDSTPVPSSDGKSDAAPGLESNPATDREPFSDRHPYYPSGCSSCPFAGNRLSALVHDLAGRGKHCNDCVKANQKIEKAEAHSTEAIKQRRTEIREAAKQFIGKEFEHPKFNRQTTISGNSLKEMLNQPHKHIVEKNEAVLHIDTLFKNAKFLGELNRKPNVNYDSFLFETEIAGEKSWIIVRQNFNVRNCVIYSISDSEELITFLKKKDT